MKNLSKIAALAAMSVSVSAVTLAQTDPFVGTWKLNVNESRFASQAMEKNETRIVSSSDKALRVSVQCVDGNGKTRTFEYTSNLDGKNYPIVGDGPYGADTIAAKLVNANAIQSTLKKDDQALATSTAVVSQEGKVLTITTVGENGIGKPFTSVFVYEKQ
jgi:hypothetical protein